jgi:dihydroorotate dehydrogenase (NAD+) catalytic subunit
MVMLDTKLASVRLKNPTVLPAGILGTTASILNRVSKSGAGAVTTKSIGPKPRAGHNNPTVLARETVVMNAVGLPTPGYKNMQEEWQELEKLKVPVIASVYGFTLKEFVEVSEFVASKKPSMIELNISCPNTQKKGMVFGCDPVAAGKIVSSVKEVTGKIPLMPKLTPNTPLLKQVARACEDAGADALAAINTVGPGMIIDVNTAKPVLAFKTGGLSGPAIKPIAVRCVYDVSEATDLPILGIGGVTTGEDAAEMLAAGASAVGIGSGVYYRGINVYEKVCSELEEFMKARGYKSVKQMVGKAHE